MFISDKAWQAEGLLAELNRDAKPERISLLE
jgi:hypothetical protein